MSTAITNTYFASEDRQMDRLVPLLCLNIEGFCAQLGQHNSVEGVQWGRGTARQIKALAVTSRAADFGTADKVGNAFSL